MRMLMLMLRAIDRCKSIGIGMCISTTAVSCVLTTAFLIACAIQGSRPGLHDTEWMPAVRHHELVPPF